MNFEDIANKSPEGAIDPDMEEMRGALRDAKNALRRLSELVHQNPYGASVLFEFTCDTCRQLGYAITEFPNTKEDFLASHSYYPAIIAEDLQGLDAGLRTLAEQGPRVQRARLKKKALRYAPNSQLNPEAIFINLLSRFVDSILCDPRHERDIRKLTAERVSQETKNRLLSNEFRYNANEWASQFIRFLNPCLLDEKAGASDEAIEWRRRGDRIPDGLLFRYAMTLLFDENGKATPMRDRFSDPIKALEEKAQRKLRSMIGEDPALPKKQRSKGGRRLSQSG